ncbi:MAG: DUF3667 domain-containing protein [Pseudomonadota bacterium]|nr:DUF3667 domain-containing protein [Pseudomonadota bacterium]
MGEANRKRQSTPPHVPLGAAGPKQPVRMEDAYFEAPVCRNCAAPLETAHCSACGQKKARRFAWRDLRNETWEHWRLFEITSARTLWRLVSSPGYVAREYVMGRRKHHMHPLKLLVLMVALLVVALNRNRFFSHFGYSDLPDAQIDRMAALVQGYANWSFSLGILAIWCGSYVVYRHRLGYNAIEHAVLAVYCQILIIAVILINMVPTLIWNTAEFVRDYKAMSANYLYAIKVVIVALAYKQFLLIELRREWPRLVGAILTYMATSWVLLRLYAAAVLAIVQAQ